MVSYRQKDHLSIVFFLSFFAFYVAKIKWQLKQFKGRIKTVKE